MFLSMKKLTALLFTLFVIAEAHAQKRYVTMTTVQASSPYAILSGDVPTSMKKEYYHPSDVVGSIFSWTGTLLNQLADEGFRVERLTSYVNPSNNYQYVIYLLSRQADTPTPSGSIGKVADDDEEVREVARYNLQGMPVDEKEKGIQIIVYSNFTTKTVIK